MCSAALRDLLRVVRDQIEKTRRGYHCVEQGVNSLEKDMCENFAKREAAETLRCGGNESRHE